MNISLEAAANHLKARNFEECEAICRALLHEEPKLNQALKLLAISYSNQQKWAEALECLVKVLPIEPDSPQLHHQVGQVLRRLNYVPEAVYHFEQSARLAPNSPEPWIELGQSLLEIGHIEDAIRSFEEARARCPGSTDAAKGIESVHRIVEQMRQLTQKISTEVKTVSDSQERSVCLPSRRFFPHLLNSLGLTGIAVEIGVQEGVYSEHLLRFWRGKLLYSVDPWRAFSMEAYADISNVSQEQHDQNYKSTIRRLAPYLGRSVIWRLTGAEASELIDEGTLDFCYLDGDHSYEGVTGDIRNWYKKVRAGGILAGHDFVSDGDHWFGSFGVRKAVQEFVQAENLELHVSGEPEVAFPSWFVRKPN